MVSSILLILFITFTSHSLAKSQIALFSDTNCQSSLRGLEGPNGYPNGTCTDLRRTGAYGSFHIVGLDPGCTVTIYANNTSEDICSGPQKEIQLIDCYDATYMYYSIDFCDPSAASSPSPLASTPKLSIGAIVGGVVGGVVALGIILCSVVFCVVRRKRAQESVGGHGAAQIEYAPQELSAGMVKYESAAVEVGQPPVELAGREMREDGARPVY